MRAENLFNWSKLYKTASCTGNGFSRLLKRWQVWFGLHTLADVTFGATLIQDGKGDSLSKWPSYCDVIIFSHHHVDKDGHISATFIFHAIEVNSYSKLVFIAISMNGWTEESYWLSVEISLATLLNLWREKLQWARFICLLAFAVKKI